MRLHSTFRAVGAALTVAAGLAAAGSPAAAQARLGYVPI